MIQFMDVIASSTFLQNYFPLIVFLMAAGILSCIMIGLGFIRGPHQPNPEKLSPYECGFNNFSDARIKFNIKYYLIAILFILFDLEIALIFPWAVALNTIGSYGFWSMMVFLTLMIVGFIYEWGKGALSWE